MSMSRIALTLLNGIYGWMISSTILVASIYSVYSIWDNAQVYQAAEDVQNEIRKLKPDEVAVEEGPGFVDLQAVNKDVVGWITVDGTNIDYPVLQGNTNLTYMDKDVYGNFSLAGSIFLDIRNKADFSDNYSLIYGHNMDQHLMFGDLALFKDKEFFKQNTTATLMMPGECRDLSVAAVLQVPAGTEEIFNPYMWKNSLFGLGEYLSKQSIWYHSTWVDRLRTEPDRLDVVALVTCSTGNTNDRTVLILVREKPLPPEDPDDPDDPSGPDGPPPGPDDPDDPDDPSSGWAYSTGDPGRPGLWVRIFIGSILFIILFELVEQFYDRKKFL